MSRKQPIDAGLIARAAAGFRSAFSGWFGAGEPLPPVAQEAEGRQFDYQPFFNTGHSRPRERETVGFDALRALADSYDILRLVIETRKDQMESAAWTIQRRDIAHTGENEAQAKDRRIDEAVAFFRQPDKEHTWSDWLRMLLEDLLVVDAPCIYPRKNLGGGLYALELIDGATIKRVLDSGGRTPQPPQTAYQQVLRGMAAVDYTTDELIYRPRNNRTYKVYGYSPVEQVVMTVNIALKRQLHALEYYTSGSVPDALVGVPETWSPDDIRRFQEYWDLLLSGESAQRRKMRFVPGEIGRNFHETKQPPLKDMYDEWLARVICFAFSIEPTPFVAQVNRSVAETSREQSLSDGLLSLKNWVKSLIDDVLARYMDMADFEFVWQEEQSLKPKEQAEIYAIYKNAGILTADEIRAELGKEPLPEQEQEPAQEPQQEQDSKQEQGGRLPESKEGRLGKSQRPISGEEAEAAALIEAFLLGQIEALAAQIARAVSGSPQAQEEQMMQMLADLDFSGWAALPSAVMPVLQRAARRAAEDALRELVALPAYDIHSRIRQRAKDWAAERAAEMVGMRWHEGRLIPNPNAEWQITEGTRQMLRQSVAAALDSGSSAQEVAAELRQSHAFSKARAQMIARTELARADGMGTYIGWQESGQVAGKEWLTAQDDKVSELCVHNENAGTLPLDALFPSGDLMPPSHPNCRCVVLPVLSSIDKAYNPSQPRDRNGRWTSSGAAVSLSGNELGEWSDMKELRHKARDYAKQFAGQTFVNERTGNKIIVSMSGVKHTIAHANDGLLKTVPAIPEIIKTANFLHSEQPKHKDSNILSVEKYVSEVKIGGVSHRMLITVKHQIDGRRYYDHGFWNDKIE